MIQTRWQHLVPPAPKKARTYNLPPPRKWVCHAPARSHSIMVVRCSFGDVVLKPWQPKLAEGEGVEPLTVTSPRFSGPVAGLPSGTLHLAEGAGIEPARRFGHRPRVSNPAPYLSVSPPNLSGAT
jgi:hypothetical protein